MACDSAGDTKRLGEESAIQKQAHEDILDFEQVAPDAVGGNDTTCNLTRQAKHRGSCLAVERGRTPLNLHGRSRVAGNLNATLRNATALGHFIQYMEVELPWSELWQGCILTLRHYFADSKTCHHVYPILAERGELPSIHAALVKG